VRQRRCSGTTKAGGRCNSFALPESDYCVTHHPGRVTDLARWRTEGGRARSSVARARRRLAPALTADELERLMGDVLRRVVDEDLDPAIASAAASVARTLVTIKETVALEGRITDLERAAGERRGRPA
jgi:hypothetical protein